VLQQVMPMVKAVPRGFTVTADAYLTPHIRDYVSAFSAGFDARLKDRAVLFMQSDGGLTSVGNFMGSRAILSGPAGGVVGYARTTYDASARQPVIGFDMGGTSTDVSRCGGRPERCNRRATLQLVRVALGCSRVVRRCRYGGHLEHVFESVTAGVTIQAPQLDINTVAAGGGSRLFYRSGRCCARGVLCCNALCFVDTCPTVLLQHAVLCCSVAWRVATCCAALQHVVLRCSVVCCAAGQAASSLGRSRAVLTRARSATARTAGSL
jgi:N-methylhydantoinase A/oxoprolinase/acetone carboxylase beta subunit